jgi:16S rRNA processing protein RimM
MSRRLAVAIITKPQGIRGEVRLKSLGDTSILLGLDKVYPSKDGDAYYEIKKAWLSKQMVCMAFGGVNTRNEAEQLRGTELYMDEDSVELDEDTHYVFDLIGCDVHDENGAKLGKVTNILQNGAADVYVIKGGRNFMMPALKKVLMSVDTQSKVIVISSKTLAEVAVYED